MLINIGAPYSIPWSSLYDPLHRRHLHRGLSSSTTLLISMGLEAMVAVWGLLGFFSEEIGLRRGWEMVLMGIW